MKKEYINPTIEIITMISEQVLDDSMFDPTGIFEGDVDRDWYNK